MRDDFTYTCTLYIRGPQIYIDLICTCTAYIMGPNIYEVTHIYNCSRIQHYTMISHNLEYYICNDLNSHK